MNSSPKIPLYDFHIHTTYSDGETVVSEIPREAMMKRLELVGVADHFSSFSDLPMPHHLRRNSLPLYLDELDSLSLLKGVEASILGGGKPTITVEDRHKLDYVLAGVHSLRGVDFWNDPTPVFNPREFVEDLRVTLISAMETRLIDVIVHPTWLPESIRGLDSALFTLDWIDSIAGTASSQKVAIELSGSWDVPSPEFVRRCLHHGVKIALGSDSHRPEQIGNLRYPLKILRLLGASREQLFRPRPSRT